MKISLFSIFGCIILQSYGNVGGNKIPSPLLDNQNAPLVAMVDMSNADEHVKQYVNDAIKTKMSQLVTTKLGDVLESLKLVEKLERYIDQVKQNLTLDVTDDIKRIVDDTIAAKAPKTIPAFTAILTKTFKPGPHDIIKFDSVKTNIGGSYSAATGVFTVPQSGLYMISATVRSWGGQHIHCQLAVNDQFYAPIFGTNWSEGAISIAIQLTKGDKVCVRNDNSNGSETVTGDTWSMFSGFLIQ
ncbi:complement C1q tumor necrosis factor-related protein 4-like [Mytilus trossulus]|uniref:complement C1q tumor necrosis factor-related protein 4-like n=1 Tax=Mytilus trossulus TaxID=6551 RepID=UPI0030078A4A